MVITLQDQVRDEGAHLLKIVNGQIVAEVKQVSLFKYTIHNQSGEAVTLYVQRQMKWVAGKVPVCPGIGVNADDMHFPGPQALLDQITIARNLNASGWTLFNYDAKLVRDYLPYLKLGASSTPTQFLGLDGCGGVGG